MQPLPSPADARNLPSVPVTYNVGGRPWAHVSSPEEASVPLLRFIGVLKRHCWKILLFVGVCVAATWFVTSRLTPVYESTAAIEIDRHMPAGILGQEATQYPTADADQFLATQLKLIQSDLVLRPVVERFKLPVHGNDRASRGAVQGAEAEEAPVVLKNLRVSRAPNTYLLLISYRSPDRQLAPAVANAIANSYILQTYKIRYSSSATLSAFMEGQLEELKAKMERSGQALAQVERELNVINPEEKTNISSARLVQLNAEYTNAEADRVKKEAAYESVRSGSLEAAQVSTQGESLKKLGERLGEAQEKFADVKARYGANHPEYRRSAAEIAQLQTQIDSALRNISSRVEIEYRQAVNRESMLKEAVARTKAELDSLSSRAVQYQALKREADADKRLYEELTTKIKEAGINAGFQNSAIRLADSARPASQPAFPSMALNLLLAFLISSVAAVAAAVVSDFLDNSIRDTKQASRLLSADVIGSLPVVRSWHGRLGHGARKDRPAMRSILPANGATSLVRAGTRTATMVSVFDDAVRTLRNCILLASIDKPLRSIMITSAFPKEGKTVVSAHLAIAHAQQGRRTLLIDADLRCPAISSLIGIEERGGFSKALLNGMEWRRELATIEGLPDLDILGAGPASPQAADLVGKGLCCILQEARKDYDIVIVDTPPILGFPEPLQIAASVDGVVLVARAGRTHRHALDSAVITLQRIRANLLGVVLNQVRDDTSHSYGYYQKNNYYAPPAR